MSYEIVSSDTDLSLNRKIEKSLVKLAEPVACRQSNTFDLYETDYVLVEALQIKNSGVVYEETHVVASNKNGDAHPSVLYLATRALTVHEAMFGIGEHNYEELGEADNG